MGCALQNSDDSRVRGTACLVRQAQTQRAALVGITQSTRQNQGADCKGHLGVAELGYRLTVSVCLPVFHERHGLPFHPVS